MSDAPWTLGRLLTWTTDYLKQHGADAPRLDAEVLLAHARGCPRIQLYANFEEVAAEDLRTNFRALVKRRAEGMPVAYLVGKREFLSLEFKVTPAVLIPRPETEHLVMLILDRIKSRGGEAVAVCDMATGSGCIAVAIAKRAPTARVTAIDISPEALAVAHENAQTHGVVDRVEFVESDLFAALKPAATFDFIASNPPYISTAEYAALAPTVRDFEPRLALEAGPRGSDVVTRLIPEAARRLNAGGTLAVEISPMLREEVVAIFQQQAEFVSVEVIKDLAGHPRVVVGNKSA